MFIALMTFRSQAPEERHLNVLMSLLRSLEMEVNRVAINISRLRRSNQKPLILPDYNLHSLQLITGNADDADCSGFSRIIFRANLRKSAASASSAFH